MIWLRDLYKSYIKSKALLYTIDMCGDSYFKCGPVADVYATVDFGPWINDGKYFDCLYTIEKYNDKYFSISFF